MSSLPKRGNEFVDANLRLTENAFQCSRSHSRVEGNSYPNWASSQPHMGTGLAQDGETKLLENPNDVGA